MRLNRVVGLVALLSTAACVKGVSQIHTRPLVRPNLTSYVFGLPLEAVRAKAMDAFSVEHQLAAPVFGHLGVPLPAPPFRDLVTFHVSTAEHATFGSDLLAIPANASDLYLQSFADPLWESPIYQGSRGGLPFVAEFHVHLSAAGSSETRVTVTARRAEVINGMEFGLGSCGPGWAWRYVPVEPTSVEEYVILRYIGQALGAPSMPNVMLPAA